MLPVSAPFHCALMQPAQEEVARVLASFDIGGPAHSRGGQRDRQAGHHGQRRARCAHPASDGRGALGGMHADTLITGGAGAFIEVGPGKVLCGLLRQIDPAQKSFNVEDAVSLERDSRRVAVSLTSWLRPQIQLHRARSPGCGLRVIVEMTAHYS